MAVDQDPEERHPAIRQWTERLQELADATGLSLRKLAEHVPWSHSTLARYLSGARVVDDAWQLVPKLIDLGMKRGNSVLVESGELYNVYLRPRKEYQEQQQRTQRSQNQTPTQGGDDQSCARSAMQVRLRQLFLP